MQDLAKVLKSLAVQQVLNLELQDRRSQRVTAGGTIKAVRPGRPRLTWLPGRFRSWLSWD